MPMDDERRRQQEAQRQRRRRPHARARKNQMLRIDGQPVGRFRRLMMVCDDLTA